MKNIRVFADTADLESVKEMARLDIVEGFTTNPTLMKKAGITNYEDFALEMLEYLKSVKPNGSVSFEVFADDEMEMVQQGKLIASWGKEAKYQVYVKIPVWNSEGTPTSYALTELVNAKVSVNVTAIFNHQQWWQACSHLMLTADVPLNHIVSVFAGRIYDCGYDAATMIAPMAANKQGNIDLLWASPRQVYDYVVADKIGCDIITMTPELIRKIPLIGTPLRLMTLDTIRMFHNDGKATGYNL